MEIFAGLEHIVRANEPLAPYTWLRVGGAAEYFAEPTAVPEVAELVKRCRQHGLPIRLLGGGSNILVRDSGTPGLVVHLGAACFAEIRVDGQMIEAGAGAKLAHVISTAVREGLGGLEQLAGIPGTIGGAVRGNSGTQNGDIGQWTEAVTVVTREGAVETRQRSELRFAYRSSSLDEPVILSARFRLEPGDPEQLTKRLQTLWIVKKSQQPVSDQNVACLFKDPGGISATSLLEQAGLKGTKVGQVELSDANANFLVANPGASCQDALRLIDLVRERVATQLGVELETEMQIW